MELFDKMDWRLLRQQKAAVLRQYVSSTDDKALFEGLIVLMDALQDAAIDDGVPERKVFGGAAISMEYLSDHVVTVTADGHDVVHIHIHPDRLDVQVFEGTSDDCYEYSSHVVLIDHHDEKEEN